jgi:hypothetical protein
VVARAQQPALPVVGFLGARAAERRLAAFRKGLGKTGYVEGQNVRVEYHWLEDQYDRVPALMADLVRRRVAVIATPVNTVGSIAAKAATETIPAAAAAAYWGIAAVACRSFNLPRGVVVSAPVSRAIGSRRLCRRSSRPCSLDAIEARDHEHVTRIERWTPAHATRLKPERWSTSTAERKLRLCFMRRYEGAPNEDRLR